MSNLTLYDLIGEDMQVTAKRVNNYQVSINITNEKGEVIFHEITHRFAWDSFVNVARQVLWNDDMLTLKEELNCD